MSGDIQRQIGERVAAQVDKLPDEITEKFVCGCFPEDIRLHDGVFWAYPKTQGFHSPFEPHLPDGVAAARLFLNDTGSLGVDC